MKVGMVLEGGAMRGIFTAGILDVFTEEGIYVDGCVGTSAGAVFGCNYKSKQKGRTLRYNLKYCRDPRYKSIRNLIFTGDLYGAQFCYEDIPNRLDPFDTKTYQNNPMDFYVCCTDIESGKAKYALCNTGDRADVLWMRASASMPMFAKPVVIEGKKYLDGGMSDSIPLSFMEQSGYEKNIVILTQPIDYVKKKTPLMPAIKMMLRKYPNAVSLMNQRHIAYNDTLSYIQKREKDGAVFVLRPPEKLPVSRTEKDSLKIQEAYDMGRRLALQQLDAIRAFLKDATVMAP